MKYLSLLFLVVLAACSSQVPQTSTYLLRPHTPVESGERGATPAVALDEVRVADYIDQPNLVLELANGTIHTARYHQWAEPLRVALRQFLASEIGEKLGADVDLFPQRDATQRLVDVRINQLHGTADGTAVLVAYWDVQQGDSRQAFQFSRRQPLAGDGYDALVAAETELLRGLAGAVADSLRQAGTGAAGNP